MKLTVSLAHQIFATVIRLRSAGQRRPANESAGRNIYMSKAPRPPLSPIEEEEH